VQEALQEHQKVKDMIAALREMGPDSQEFDTKFRELMQNVEHRVEEEETEMFLLAEQELSEDLDDIKEEMQELKKEMMAS
jgi:hemerythrin-like domain-containing protein